MVYYRKYRPQTIAELDSPKLRETLYAVLGGSNVPHSFLFTGPKGLGKTSTARIIAKVLNCEHIDEPQGPTVKGKEGEKALNASRLSVKANIEPDNICDQCVSITNGSNIDVLEIDGASNRGIDEIRELRERVNLAPSSAKKKVYIIDEVHMLTTEAFNALLKTIEEPPAHVVFIFCTTEPQKVPATIVSRCFHVSLNRATDEELIHSLKRIVVEEKMDIDEEALALIAHLGDGGFRDTQKLFEEVVALSNGAKITKDLVEEKAGVSGISFLVASMFTGLEKKDAKGCLDTIQQLTQQGTDIKYFISELLSALHQLLLRQVGISTPNIPQVQFSTEEIQELAGLLQQAYKDTKFAVILQLPLELAVVTWCAEGTREINEPKKTEGAFLPNNSKPTVTDLLKKEKNLKVQVVLGKAPAPVVVKREDTHKQENLPENANGNAVFLENIIYKVKPFNHSVAGVLRGCTIKLLDGERIVFETPYKFHKEKLEEARTREILEKGVREITGKNLAVMVELKTGS